MSFLDGIKQALTKGVDSTKGIEKHQGSSSKVETQPKDKSIFKDINTKEKSDISDIENEILDIQEEIEENNDPIDKKELSKEDKERSMEAKELSESIKKEIETKFREHINNLPPEAKEKLDEIISSFTAPKSNTTTGVPEKFGPFPSNEKIQDMFEKVNEKYGTNSEQQDPITVRLDDFEEITHEGSAFRKYENIQISEETKETIEKMSEE